MLPKDLWCWDGDQVYKELQVLQQNLCDHLLRHTLKTKKAHIYVLVVTEFIKMHFLIMRTPRCLGYYCFNSSRKKKTVRLQKKIGFFNQRKKLWETSVCRSYLQRKEVSQHIPSLSFLPESVKCCSRSYEKELLKNSSICLLLIISAGMQTLAIFKLIITRKSVFQFA